MDVDVGKFRYIVFSLIHKYIHFAYVLQAYPRTGMCICLSLVRFCLSTWGRSERHAPQAVVLAVSYALVNSTLPADVELRQRHTASCFVRFVPRIPQLIYRLRVTWTRKYIYLSVILNTIFKAFETE